MAACFGRPRHAFSFHSLPLFPVLFFPRIFSPATGRLVAGAALLLVAACKKDNNSPAAPQTPAAVSFTQAALYPEGLEYDATGQRFFVSSLSQGAIGQVKDDGTYSAFADDPQLVSTAGLQLDAARNRLLVAVSDFGNTPRSTPATAGKLAALATFDATTGTRTGYVNLSGLRPNQAHFANDITFDAQGNYYVTDSFSPIIYKVDNQGVASVFLEDSKLDTPAGTFGLNGLVFHPDGYLLVLHSTQGVLYKVPLANPAAFTAVPVATSLAGADGLFLQDNQHVLVASNSQNLVLRLATTTGWTAATSTGSFATGNIFPTSLAPRGPDTYVLYSHINTLLSGAGTPAAQYSINKVAL